MRALGGFHDANVLASLVLFVSGGTARSNGKSCSTRRSGNMIRTVSGRLVDAVSVTVARAKWRAAGREER